MADLTKEEKRWLRRVQAALDSCPSKRLGFYTVGDADLSVYDRTHEKAIHAAMDEGKAGDFGPAVDLFDADFYTGLRFPALVHSVAG